MNDRHLATYLDAPERISVSKFPFDGCRLEVTIDYRGFFITWLIMLLPPKSQLLLSPPSYTAATEFCHMLGLTNVDVIGVAPYDNAVIGG